MSIEIDNAKEEIKEIIEKCFRCGLCKSLCPVLKVTREEHFSPRGKITLLDNKVFEGMIYDCTLCKGCSTQCPLELKLGKAFMNARKVLVLQEKDIPENLEMIKNLEETGNIFGINQEG